MGDRVSRATKSGAGRARFWHILVLALLVIALATSFAVPVAEAKGKPEHVQEKTAAPPGKAVGRATTPAAEATSKAHESASSESNAKAERGAGRARHDRATEPTPLEPAAPSEPAPPVTPVAPPPGGSAPPLPGPPDLTLREQRETFEFVHWTEGRTLMVLAFALPDDDHEEASYLWDWGDGTRFFDGPYSMHQYSPESGDVFAITATRYNTHGATHQATRWIDLRMVPIMIDLPHAARQDAPTSNPSHLQESRAEEPVTMTFPAPNVVYEAPVPPLSTLILLAGFGIALRNIRSPSRPTRLFHQEESANGNR